jgi:hypothetical protein
MNDGLRKGGSRTTRTLSQCALRRPMSGTGYCRFHSSLQKPDGIEFSVGFHFYNASWVPWIMLVFVFLESYKVQAFGY